MSISNAVNLGSVEDLEKLLDRFQINRDKWRKKISDLYSEVKIGDCILSIEKGKLHRLVNGVSIKCFYTNGLGDRYQLIENKQIFKNGQELKRNLKCVSEKLQTGESPEQGAIRGLFEELKISGPDVHVIPFPEENRCDTVDAPDYSGIQTTYDTSVFTCEIPESHYKNSYEEVQDDWTTSFSWVKI